MTTCEIDVLVIGGGPAGVAAAVELRRNGVANVVLLEREPSLGGATRHCSHSPFGMLEYKRVFIGAAYGRRLEADARNAGVDVRTQHSVIRFEDNAAVVVSSPKGVETLRARRIITTTGARETPRSARLISGSRPIGVVTTGTLQAYVAFHGLMPFRRPVIVGSELVTMSSIITCLSHGAKPVALLERRAEPLVRAPFRWLPQVAGIPFYRNATIVDIKGNGRVDSVTVKIGDELRDIGCDGVLLTGEFTPESALFLQSDLGVQRGSSGPMIDQDGRMQNPAYFAAGNVLRGVETGGWSYREGRSVGRAVAEDLCAPNASSNTVPVIHDPGIKLVVPGMMRPSDLPNPAFKNFQLRVHETVTGELSLELDGKTVRRKRATWKPERRILVPIPAEAARTKKIVFRLKETTT